MTGWPDASTLFGWMFALTFLGVACWEAWRPSRVAIVPLTLRWFGNISLFAIVLLMTWLVPLLSGLGAATLAAKHGWGLFYLMALPPVIALAAGFVLLDFFAYWTHRLLHKIPLLWRLHALHHSDSDLDVTTAIRHHPAEAMVQALCDAMLALLFGFPPQAVLLYGGTVLVVQTFHHGNVILPPRLKPLSRLLITPDLHRLHHSMAYAENNSNYGNLIPLWDRLFGTLRQEAEGELRIGLPEFPGAEFQRLDKLLIQPIKVVVIQGNQFSDGRT
jgi:sterol desaturase/sphingolipid hydroxylase (fatty acid hydroxylase superfamily)